MLASFCKNKMSLAESPAILLLLEPDMLRSDGKKRERGERGEEREVDDDLSKIILGQIKISGTRWLFILFVY